MPAEPQAAMRILDDLSRWLRDRPATDAQIAAAAEIRFNRPIPDYYHPNTLKEIVSARNFFLRTRDDSAEWSLVFAAMLHILHGNRPYALSRNSHPLTPYAPTGPVEYRSVIEKLREKVVRSLAAKHPSGFVAGRCLQVDALGEWPDDMGDLDAVITSPPFFDSTRFYMANWMRYWFAGWSKADFTSAPADFMETKQQQSFDVYRVILERCRERLRRHGLVVFHLGLSRKCDMAASISAIVPHGFDVLDLFVETVEHCESHGVRDKGTVTGHQFLILRSI
jgi:hypothetical protein